MEKQTIKINKGEQTIIELKKGETGKNLITFEFYENGEPCKFEDDMVAELHMMSLSEDGSTRVMGKIIPNAHKGNIIFLTVDFRMTEEVRDYNCNFTFIDYITGNSIVFDNIVLRIKEA